MADKKISELPSLALADIVPGVDTIPVVNGGLTKQATIADVVNSAEDFRLRTDLAADDGLSLVGFLQEGVDAVEMTAQDKARLTLHGADFGVIPDTGADMATKINNALTRLSALGGGVLWLPAGVITIETTILLPDYCWIVGAGQQATTIKLADGADVDLLTKAVGADGVGASVVALTFDGNDTNNTAGGVFFAGADTGRGPTITLEKVRITACRASVGGTALGVSGALVTTGSVWGVSRDCDIDQNQNASGWVHRGSDWLIDGLYLGPNGATSGSHSLIIQGAGNRYSNAYFGGNGGLSQVVLWGASRNLFLNCLNDNSWQNAYAFVDLLGVSSDDNMFVGGQVSSAGWSVDDTFYCFEFTGGAKNTLIVGVKFIGLQANQAKYAIHEQDTAADNFILGGSSDGNFGTSFDGRRAGGGSMISNVMGFDSTDVVVVTGGDGSAATPTYGFGAESGIGFWRRASNVLSVALSGSNYAQFSTGSMGLRMPIVFASGDVATTPPDVEIRRGAADVLELGSGDSFRPTDASAQKLGDASHTWRVYHDVVETASLPAADAALNGVVLIEDAGAGDRNLIVYAGAQRFRIDGGASF
jgi:hypothetical protein